MTFRGAIPRVVSDEDLSSLGTGRLMDVMRAVTMILAVPQSVADDVDALVVATGQGEHWRLTHAIRHWEAHPAIRHLLVANGNPAERTYVDITPDYLRGLGLSRVDGVHLQAEPAPNTSLQAEWIVQQVQERGITSLALAVSPYHLPRAYLTVLKAFIDSDIRLPLVPLPVAVSPDTPVPETGSTAYDLIPGEVQRIIAYAEKGWVATPDELRQYLHWMWSRWKRW